MNTTDLDMKYRNCIDRLYSIAPSFQNVGSAAYHPGLQTMKDFASVTGDPQLRFRSIHIAGTNGKGSTAHMLASALAALHPGSKVGLYTSPHLVDSRERIKVLEFNEKDTGVESCADAGPASCARMISRGEVVEFMERYGSFIEERRPSFFEITTAMAFEHFAAVGVEFAVIETGLGGRLDSTNILPSELSVITSVGLDHVNILGNSIEQIAREKAGIIKQGKPVVIGKLQGAAARVVRSVARDLDAPRYDSQVEFERLQTEYVARTIADFQYSSETFDLKSDSQEINFKTVLTALDVLGYNLADQADAVMYALRNAARLSGLRGRWETIHAEPLALCDIGHNEEAMKISVKQLKQQAIDLHERYGEGGHIYMVFGMVADKDVANVADLLPVDASYIFTQPHGSRAMDAETLAAIVLESIRRRSSAHIPFIGELPVIPVENYIVTNPAEAYRLALELASPHDIVFVGGSSFVVSEVLAVL